MLSAPSNQALNAAQAGELLAELLGLPDPIDRTRVWRLARLRYIPAIRLGKRLLFRSIDLEAFVARGGTLQEQR